MARFTPTKLFHVGGLTNADDLPLYVAPPSTQVLLKQLLVTNTASAGSTFGLSIVDNIWNTAEPNDAFPAYIGAPVATTTGGWSCSNGALSLTTVGGYPALTVTASASNGPQLILGVQPFSSNGLAVAPNTTYTLTAAFEAATTARSITSQVNWYTASGVFLSSSSAFVINPELTTAFTTGTFNLTSPAGAAFAVISFTYNNAAASEKHYMNNFGFYPAGIATQGYNPQFRTASRIIPDQNLAQGLTAFDLSTLMNPYDFISAKAGTNGVINIYASGLLVN